MPDFKESSSLNSVNCVKGLDISRKPFIIEEYGSAMVEVVKMSGETHGAERETQTAKSGRRQTDAIIDYNRRNRNRKENIMFQSNVFDYVNVLDKAMDASWLRHEAISNNLSNVDTPGYKRQDVAFEDVLKDALGQNRFQSMDSKVASLNLSRLQGRVYTDYASFSYRLDKNNVDVDNEGVMLAENQLKYQGLMTAVQEEFSNLKLVMQR